MIEKIKEKLRRTEKTYLFHDTKKDIEILVFKINQLIDKTNEIIDAVNRIENSRQ